VVGGQVVARVRRSLVAGTKISALRDVRFHGVSPSLSLRPWAPGFYERVGRAACAACWCPAHDARPTAHACSFGSSARGMSSGCGFRFRCISKPYPREKRGRRSRPSVRPTCAVQTAGDTNRRNRMRRAATAVHLYRWTSCATPSVVRRGSTVRVRQRAFGKCLQIGTSCRLHGEHADTPRTHLRYARRTPTPRDAARRNCP
jgi:hypothetical protein